MLFLHRMFKTVVEQERERERERERKRENIEKRGIQKNN